MAAQYPTLFLPGPRTIDGSALNDAFDMPRSSSEDNITAHAGGGKSRAYQLNTPLNRVTTAATTGDSVRLPLAITGRSIFIINADPANAIQVYGYGTDTINGVATGTGVSQSAGATEYTCLTRGSWITVAQGGGSSNTRRTISSGTSDAATRADGFIGWNSASTSAKSQSIPSSINSGQVITIADVANTAGTYQITITPVSGTIAGGANYVIDTSGQSGSFIDTDTGWVPI